MAITKTKKKNKDGLFLYRVRVSYQDSSGVFKVKEKSVYGLQFAKDVEYNLKHELLNNSKNIPNNINFSEFIDIYLNYKKIEVRESSLQTSCNRIRNYISPFFKNIYLRKITTKTIIDWKLWLENKNLSYSTKKNAYTQLKAIFHFAIKLDYISSNPMAKVKNFKDVNFSKEEISVYTADEFKLFINECFKNAVNCNFYDYYVFFNIAFYTGMRKGEIHALKWSDLNCGVIEIRKSIQQKINPAAETPPKNKSSIRDIKIPIPLINILDEHKKRQALQPAFNEDNYICGMIRPLADSTIDKKNRQFAKDAKLHRIRIHDYRHTHASILIDNGIAITEIARRLGHSDIKETLNTYAHFFPSQEEKAVEILNTL